MIQWMKNNNEVIDNINIFILIPTRLLFFMFKFRTLTICLKLRVVVTVLWEVSCGVSHLLSGHHLSSLTSVVAEDFSSFCLHYWPVQAVQAIRNTVLTWNEKKNKSQGIYTKNKGCTWPLSSLYLKKKEQKRCSITATCSPPNIYSKTLLPSEKSYRTQYITFCFTSLELQNERARMGGKQK